MKLSDYQLKHFASHFLCVGDIGASKASKSFRVNPNNEGNTIEINVNINVNGTNEKYPASGNYCTPEFRVIWLIFKVITQ